MSSLYKVSIIFGIIISGILTKKENNIDFISTQIKSMDIFGIILFLLSYALVNICMLYNNHFYNDIFIDNNHLICSEGPYKFIRHPGYLAFMMFYSSILITLGGSFIIVYLPIIGIITSFIIMTYYEDSFLQDNLTGYKEFCKKTKYKLFYWLF